MANQIFCKKINVVVEDYKAILSQKLKFYKEDSINIKFYITQINVETLEKPDGSIVFKVVFRFNLAFDIFLRSKAKIKEILIMIWTILDNNLSSLWCWTS